MSTDGSHLAKCSKHADRPRQKHDHPVWNSVGAATKKARSPNSSLVPGMYRLSVVAHRRTRWHDGDGWKKVGEICRYPAGKRAWCFTKQSLYWKRASASNQSKSIATDIQLMTATEKLEDRFWCPTDYMDAIAITHLDLLWPWPSESNQLISIG